MSTGTTLYRSRDERMIAGVCGGLAERYGLDPTLVRLIAVLLAIVTNAAAVIAYIVMWIVVPEAPAGESAAAGSVGAPAAPPRPPAPEPPPMPEAPEPPGYRQPEPAAKITAPVSRASETPRAARPGGGAVWLGVVFVAIGLFIITARIWPDVDIWAFWPLIIVLLGIRTMLTRGRDETWNVNRLVEGATGVLIGGILLANTTGVLGLSVWLAIASLWPLLIVAAGVDIIGKGLDNLWLRTFSSLIVLGGILVGVFVVHQQPLSFSMGLFGPRAEAFELSEPADAGISAAKAEIKGAAGDISLASGDDLISAVGSTPFGEADLDVTTSGGTAEASLTMGEGDSVFFYQGSAYMDVELSDDVAWDLDIDTGFSKLDADLSDLDVRALSIDTGVADAVVTLGEPASGAGTVGVNVSAGVSAVTVRIPEGAEARVRSTGGIGTVHTPGGGGPAVGDRTWESDGYEDASDRYLIEIATGVGSVRVEYY